MPFLNKLEFVEKSLSVSYRGSLEPQTLDISADVPWPLHDMFGDMGPLCVQYFILQVNRGLFGGTEFAPTDGKAELLEGPKPKRVPPQVSDYHWVIQLSGVTPVALRVLIEELRMAPGRIIPLNGLTLRGSLQLDNSELSVREGEVAAWLGACCGIALNT
jgi:hypothetical protein